MGGDEFVVLIPDLSDLRFAEDVAAKIVPALSAPIPFPAFPLYLTVSVGGCAHLQENWMPMLR